MNETRQLMFGLKMSLTPGEKNKRLDWLPMRLCSLSSHTEYPLYTEQPLLGNGAILCN